jgi:hypothetical protein
VRRAALGFVPVPATRLAAAVMITLCYALVSEAAKLWFFARPRYRDMFHGS